MNARRAKTKVVYNGFDITEDISGSLLDFSFTDNEDKSDDISLKLEDRNKKWSSAWFPETGDTINASIFVYDWNHEHDNRSIDLGLFEVDEFSMSDTVSIKAVSVPITSSARSEKKNKAWEKIKLSAIAGDIAGKAGLSLVYEAEVNPFYDRTDQNDVSDLAFLEELCKSDGMCLKVSDKQLIIFEESKYDTLPAVVEIVRGSSKIIGFPDFKRNAKNIYSACEISYFDSKTDMTYTGGFDAPNAPNVGHVLRLNENFNGESDDINLNRKAKSRLREKNKHEWTASFRLHGDIIYCAGTNVNVKGFNKFDGKYHIETVTHSIGGNGYTSGLQLRRCLEGY